MIFLPHFKCLLRQWRIFYSQPDFFLHNRSFFFPQIFVLILFQFFPHNILTLFSIILFFLWVCAKIGALISPARHRSEWHNRQTGIFLIMFWLLPSFLNFLVRLLFFSIYYQYVLNMPVSIKMDTFLMTFPKHYNIFFNHIWQFPYLIDFFFLHHVFIYVFIFHVAERERERDHGDSSVVFGWDFVFSCEHTNGLLSSFNKKIAGSRWLW